MSERQPIALPAAIIGLGIMGMGVVLVLGTLGLVEARALLRFWPVLLIVLGAALVVQAIWGRGAPVAEGGPDVGYSWFVWLIVVVAIFSYVDQRRGAAADGAGPVNVHAIMSRQQRLVAADFQGATVTSVMGRSLLDLRNASLAAGEEAVVDVFALMGRIEVHVPPDWVLDVQTVSILGGVDGERPRRRREADADRVPAGAASAPAAGSTTPTTTPPRLVLRGIILMGGMDVAR
jgi:hypothetical protein